MKWHAVIEQRILKIWYEQNVFTYLLLPFTYLFLLIISLRKFCYKKNLFKTTKFSVPIIVVGNITVGGSGKTSLVVWLAKTLSEQGYKPGIVSRGYGAKFSSIPQYVTAQSDVVQVGDEPLMLAQQTKCPIVVGVNRVAAVDFLLRHSDCNLIISDDGLQHYALSRTVEIAVIDGQRRFGNGLLLPAGPLREPLSRLDEIDFIVVNGKATADSHFSMELLPQYFVNLKDETQHPLNFTNETVHAVAGIGNPTRFFNQLRQLGFNIIEHPFSDHYPFSEHNFSFAKQGEPIIMTAKDAVKCKSFAKHNYWYLAITPLLSCDFKTRLLRIIQEKTQ